MGPRRKREWFDDDSLWREIFPLLFPERRFAGAIRETADLLRLVRPKGKVALDLCCGPGVYSIPLAKRGYRVTGVDRTRHYLARAQARAKRERVRIEWIRRDMRDFVRPDAFDLVLNMEASFGYFEDRREDHRVLGSIVKSLRPGGVFVMELLGKEQLAHIFAPVTVSSLPGGARIFQRHEIVDDWTRIRNEWTVVRRGRAKTYTFRHWLYSGQELRDLFEGAGFVRVKVYGGFRGEEYGLNAQRLLAVGRRPAAEGPGAWPR